MSETEIMLWILEEVGSIKMYQGGDDCMYYAEVTYLSGETCIDFYATTYGELLNDVRHSIKRRG
jgi:hypothetical protein